MRYTQNGKVLYAHIYAYPFVALRLKGLGGEVDYMQILHDASEVLWDEDGEDIIVKLPVVKPNQIVPVIEIFLK